MESTNCESGTLQPWPGAPTPNDNDHRVQRLANDRAGHYP